MSSVSVSMYKKIMIQYDGCSLANVSLYILSWESPSWQRPSFSDERRGGSALSNTSARSFAGKGEAPGERRNYLTADPRESPPADGRVHSRTSLLSTTRLFELLRIRVPVSSRFCDSLTILQSLTKAPRRRTMNVLMIFL